MGCRGTACQEEQRHNLDDPGDRRQRRQPTQQIADPKTVGVDGGEQERAMPEHHHHQGAQAGDVDGSVTAG
jgi:hypothetical protein